MASAEYIAAAKKANRQPTCFVKIEQADSNVLYYTTQTDWSGSDTLTNVSYDGSQADSGDIIHENIKQTPPTYYNFSPSYYQGYVKHNKSYANFVNKIVHGVAFDSFTTTPSVATVQAEFAGGPIQTRIKLSSDVTFATGVTTSDVFNYTLSYAVSGVLVYGWGGFDPKEIGLGLELSASTDYYYKTEMYIGGAWVEPYHDFGYSDGFAVNTIISCSKTAQLITSAIDMGSVLTSQPVFSADDVNESGASISYSYTYSDNDISYSSGGSIVDGGTLTAARYYKIQADFATTTGGRGTIRELQISEGLFRYYGTHIDEPFSGVQPYIIEDSVSSLNQRIKIGEGMSTTGEVSVKLQWVSDTADLIASGYLKGKDVVIYSGFVGLDTESYEPVITGTWYDHDLDEINRVITVKVRDAFKQLYKRKLPEETVNNTTGAISNRTLTYTTSSLVTVMKDIFDKISLRDRYIHPDFDTLEAGDYAVTKYKVSRDIYKPTESSDLLDELAVTGSMFLVPLGDGRIKPKPFNRNQQHTAELDAFEIDFVNLKGNIKDFFSRFYAYYNPNVNEPTKSDDYDNGYALIDATAELRWTPEKGTKQHFDKWKVGRTAAGTALTVPPQALIDLVTMWNGFFTEPLYTVTAKNLPPRYADIEPSDVIQVNNLYLPVVNEAWDSGTTYSDGDRVIHDGRMWRSRVGSNTNQDPTSAAAYWQDMEITEDGLTIGKHFFVLGRKFDPNNALIDLDLLEMPPGTIGAFSSAEFSTAFDI